MLLIVYSFSKFPSINGCISVTDRILAFFDGIYRINRIFYFDTEDTETTERQLGLFAETNPIAILTVLSVSYFNSISYNCFSRQKIGFVL